jgi:hypothetical protein
VAFLGIDFSRDRLTRAVDRFLNKWQAK